MSKKTYASYFITEPDSNRQELLIALACDYGFTGFEQMENGFSATAPEKEIDEAGINQWLRDNKLVFTKSIIEEQNWNEQWERSFEPIVVDDFCAVRAAFHTPVHGVQHDIIITPKMSFGTGHHATTYMMMQAMQQLDFENKTVIDFGTGTGILAILAEKMGAAKVEAIDYDDWCIENGTENIAANRCKNITLKKDMSLAASGKADIILANINKNVLLENMSSLSTKLNLHGKVLLSGLLTGDEKEINQSAGDNRLHQKQIIHKNGWICILFAAQNDGL